MDGIAASSIEIIEKAQAFPATISEYVLRDAIDQVVDITANTYARESASYATVRKNNPWEWDEHITDKLLRLMRDRIARGEIAARPEGKWRLLDVGAGYGRDVMRFSQEPDIDAVALEHSAGFVDALRKLQANGQLGLNAVVAADMRDMSAVPDASFDCVRNHATLHHLPVVPHGLGADAAVAESRRVLRHGGVFYVLVKAGNGVHMIDTGEGLSGRFFQLFTSGLLEDLLERNAFSVVQMESGIENRPSGRVDWLFSLAVAI